MDGTGRSGPPMKAKSGRCQPAAAVLEQVPSSRAPAEREENEGASGVHRGGSQPHHIACRGFSITTCNKPEYSLIAAQNVLNSQFLKAWESQNLI